MYKKHPGTIGTKTNSIIHAKGRSMSETHKCTECGEEYKTGMVLGWANEKFCMDCFSKDHTKTRTDRNSTVEQNKWVCPKCKNNEFETDRFAATGGGFAKMFDIQNKKFTSVTCTRCKYTEIYKAETGMLGNIFDFFS